MVNAEKQGNKMTVVHVMSKGSLFAIAYDTYRIKCKAYDGVPEKETIGSKVTRTEMIVSNYKGHNGMGATATAAAAAGNGHPTASSREQRSSWGENWLRLKHDIDRWVDKTRL